MKKTIPISISNTLFYIEEDSYSKLDAYLSEIKKYFSTYDDRFEIIQDIESRIREQLIEFSDADKTERIIIEKHVDALIANMGWPQEFGMNDDQPAAKKETEATSIKNKRLYRSKDRAIIGGVASGLAIFLGINITLVRIIFILFTLAHGFGILIYIILWFALPIPETATEILEMKGGPMNLDGVKKIIEQKINEVGGKEKMKSNAKNFFEDVRNFIIKVFGKAFKVLGAIIGVGLKVGSVVAITTMIVLLIVSVMPFGYQNAENVFNQFHTLPYYYILITLIFIGGFVPAVFMNNLGNVFMGKKLFKNVQHAIVGFAIWIAALILGPLLFMSVGNVYEDKMNANIEATKVVETRAVQPFTKLTIRNGLNVHVNQGTTTSFEVRGSKTKVDRLALEQNEGSLTIENKPDMNFCFFCNMQQTEIFITVPNINSLSIENGSDVDMNMNTADLEVKMRNGSRLTLEGAGTNLNLKMENASDLEAEDYVVDTAKVDLSNGSRADLSVTAEITGKVSNASDIDQHGKGATDRIKKSNGSRVNEVEE